MGYIFVSYSHDDNAYAHHLAAALEQVGFQVWIDGRIDYGTEWPDVIERSLDGCAVFVVIMTSRSRNSTWVKNELSRAQRLGKVIMPLLLEGDGPWLSVESIQYIDVRDGKLPPRRFVDALKKTISEYEQTAPSASMPSKVAFTLPLLEWCEIPTGEVMIGENRQRVEAFRIAKYPLTNAQFQSFVDAADGYRDLRWWEFSPHARAWRADNNIPSPPVFMGDNGPRENVTWYEALAFCGWLTRKSGLAVTLPTEQQWLRAARGDDQRLYPWGDKFDKTRCNVWESHLNSTTPVTRYTEGVSSFGLFDMAGNVWEWCLTRNTPGDTRQLQDTMRMLRGGSWADDRSYAKLSAREFSYPASRNPRFGFRLVCSLSPAP